MAGTAALNELQLWTLLSTCFTNISKQLTSPGRKPQIHWAQSPGRLAALTHVVHHTSHNLASQLTVVEHRIASPNRS
jgi:hypothetical protein